MSFVARNASRALPRTTSRRTFATEPINRERGDSKTPMYLVGAGAVLVAAYLYAGGSGQTPASNPTPASQNIENTAGKNAK